MHAAVVVVHEVERDIVRVIADLFAKSVRQSCESAHLHAHREVLPLHVRRGNVTRIGIALDDRCTAADDLRRTVSALLPVRRIDFVEHAVVDFASFKRRIDGHQVCAIAVRGQLYTIADAVCEVVHETVRRAARAVTDEVRDDQLGIGIDRRPRPNISVSEQPEFFDWHVLLFRVAERPDFIALNPLNGQIAHMLVVVERACLSEILQQFFDGHARHAGHARSRAQAVAFDESGNHVNPVSRAQSVHNGHYTCSRKYCQIHGGCEGWNQ